MKGLVKGILIGTGAVAAAIGGIVTYKKVKGKEVEAEAEVKEPEEINPEYARIFLGKDVEAEEG